MNMWIVLDYPKHNFLKLQMNLKCQVTFNINTINILIIHITIEFNDNHIINEVCKSKVH
jgi:hypothetical protein